MPFAKGILSLAQRRQDAFRRLGIGANELFRFVFVFGHQRLPIRSGGAITPSLITPSAPYWRPTGVLGFGTHALRPDIARSEEHTSELQSLMRISYAVFCL